MGSLYRRGTVWWCKYYVAGRPVRVSTETTKEKDAREFLKLREGSAAAGEPVLPRASKVRYEEARDDLKRHYETTGSRGLAEAGWPFAHLDKFFLGRRLVTISGARISEYVAHRQGEKASNGTINRELGVLVKMLRLAYDYGKLLRLPVVHKPKESAPRAGFFEQEQFEAVRRQLPDDLKVAVTIAYTFGWRMQSEVLTLERRQVDLEEGAIRLDPGMTKNDDGRIVYMPADVKRMVALQVDRVRTLERNLGRVLPHLFPHLEGRFKGARQLDFRKTWASACKNVGVAGMLRHDFRRTAVRNMVNASVPERVAMKVTGHKTRAVFDRYHIVSPADLQEVARKLTGTATGTIRQV